MIRLISRKQAKTSFLLMVGGSIEYVRVLPFDLWRLCEERLVSDGSLGSKRENCVLCQ